jgi:GT2 family glycosyltransferase
VGNEDELNDRILKAGHKPLLCLRAFIYHYKDKTFNRAKHKVDRENLQYYRCAK